MNINFRDVRSNVLDLAISWPMNDAHERWLPRDQVIAILESLDKHAEFEGTRGVGTHFGFFYAKIKAHAVRYDIPFDLPEERIEFWNDFIDNERFMRKPLVIRLLLQILGRAPNPI